MSEDTYSYDIDDVENDEEIEANIEVGEAEDGDDIDENDDELIENKRETRFDIVNMEKTYENYHTQKKVTKPFLTKFERAKIIGVRAEMIASGAPSLLDVPKGITDAYKIAKLEFKERKIPLLIRRYLPNGMAEDWRLSDMVIFE
jgi:DNA-directed RNA polymerase I, II, and III subunit RPABC2